MSGRNNMLGLVAWLIGIVLRTLTFTVVYLTMLVCHRDPEETIRVLFWLSLYSLVGVMGILALLYFLHQEGEVLKVAYLVLWLMTFWPETLAGAIITMLCSSILLLIIFGWEACMRRRSGVSIGFTIRKITGSK